MLAVRDRSRAGDTYVRPELERQPVSEDAELATIASLLDNEHARQVLEATSVEQLSAAELSERCDASLPTVSRVVDRLAGVDLLTERTRVRADGHHDTVYVATLERVEVTLADGTLDLSLSKRPRDPADELADLWEKF